MITLSTVPARFEEKHIPEPTSGCWLWLASTDASGYGWFYWKGWMRRAHTLMCEWAHGPPPTSGSCVLHSCDTPSCVNPDHLRWGTKLDNARDRDGRGRNGFSRLTHCKRNHQFTEENTRVRSDGSRVCRTCERGLREARRAQ